MFNTLQHPRKHNILRVNQHQPHLSIFTPGNWDNCKCLLCSYYYNWITVASGQLCWVPHVLAWYCLNVVLFVLGESETCSTFSGSWCVGPATFRSRAPRDLLCLFYHLQYNKTMVTSHTFRVSTVRRRQRLFKEPDIQKSWFKSAYCQQHSLSLHATEIVTGRLVWPLSLLPRLKVSQICRFV